MRSRSFKDKSKTGFTAKNLFNEIIEKYAKIVGVV